MMKHESNKLQSCWANDMNMMMSALLEVVVGGVMQIVAYVNP